MIKRFLNWLKRLFSRPTAITPVGEQAQEKLRDGDILTLPRIETKPLTRAQRRQAEREAVKTSTEKYLFRVSGRIYRPPVYISTKQMNAEYHDLNFLRQLSKRNNRRMVV